MIFPEVSQFEENLETFCLFSKQTSFSKQNVETSSSQVCFPMLLFLALTFNSKQSPFSHENDKSGKDCQEMEIMHIPFFVYGNDRQLS